MPIGKIERTGRGNLHATESKRTPTDQQASGYEYQSRCVCGFRGTPCNTKFGAIRESDEHATGRLG